MKAFNELVGNGREYGLYGAESNCFKLGRWTFEAIEDESDGYRSMMDEVRSRSTRGLCFYRAPVAKVFVQVADQSAGGWYSFKGYVLRDKKGHVWLRFGTDNADDYYPSFIFEYTPEGVGE